MTKTFADSKLHIAEIKSICVTMIAGGLDTTPACMLLGTAILSGSQGASLQKKLLDDINSVYPDGDAWGKCLVEEKCTYVMAFCKEVLRFWTVIPMSLPRVSIKDVVYQGATIPAGTTFLMVRTPHYPQQDDLPPSSLFLDLFFNVIEWLTDHTLKECVGSRLRRGPLPVPRRVQT